MPGATPWGNELLLTGSAWVQTLSITALPNGQFAAAWMRFVLNTGGNVYQRSFDAYGNGLGAGEHPVDLIHPNAADGMAIMALSDGRLVSVWAVNIDLNQGD